MFQSPSSWEAGGLSYLLYDRRFPSLHSTRHPFLQLPHTRRTFVRVELSSVPALLGWTALANCSSSTTPSLLDVRQHRTSAGHVKAVSAVVRPLLEHYTERDTMLGSVGTQETHQGNMLWECHLCVLVYATQQVSKSVMAVVPGGYCLTKPWLKGSVVTAENVGRLNGEIQYVSLDQAGFLSRCTLCKGQFKKS